MAGHVPYIVAGATIAALLLTFTAQQPSEVQHVPPVRDAPELTKELKQLRQLLGEQQEASRRQAALIKELVASTQSLDPTTSTSDGGSPSAAGTLTAGVPSVAAAPPASSTAIAAQIAAAERRALDRCTEDDVPILKLLRKPCHDRQHSYGCREPWGLSDRFLPPRQQWVAEWNASARSAVNCQRAFFDALADRMTRAHWEVEWDAQPFRISAVPPRTIGKMLHQIVS